MKIAILTFQFAHNYGALLQAYALKNYLSLLGHDVFLAPYYPDWAKAEYAISPFAKNIPPRRRVRLAVQYFDRKKQSQVFESFIEEKLKVGKTFASSKKLTAWLEQYDCVVCGSDQIWNSSITGDSADYYASACSVRKIAYAASLGKMQLTETQKTNILKYLPSFAEISVRESNSAELIASLLNRKVQVVLDPVFLINADVWMRESLPVNVKSKYMLLYFLQDNSKLLDFAKRYASNNNLQIYEIHPTMTMRHDGCTQLKNIGPLQFVWLIQNAACVCTNSFHATAFSTIFKKKLIHIPNANSPERTTSLLNRIGMPLKGESDFPFYDLMLCDDNDLNSEIETSKKFIALALKK